MPVANQEEDFEPLNHATGRDLLLISQDLKDFARRPGLDVVYSEVSRGADGRGYVTQSPLYV